MNTRIVLILVVYLMVSVMCFADESYSARKSAMAPPMGDDKLLLRVRNDTIVVQLDDVDGQFNIGKYVGNITLLYAFPSSPWSSWTCFYIDGVHYSNDFGSLDPTGSLALGGGTVAFPFTIVPHSGDSSYIWGGWRQSGLDIYQMLQPCYVDHAGYRDAYIFIKYVVINTSTTARRVGIILQLDTMIDSNDAAELGTIWGYSGIEEDWYYDSMPPWWFAYESGPPLLPGDIVAMGILDGFDAVRPYRFCVGSWPSFNSSGRWGYAVTHLPYGDSSVLYYWGIDTLAPGDTMIAATYYGIGHPFHSGSFSFVVDDIRVNNCVYSPNPFSFFVMFTNESAMMLSNVRVHLDLPTGFVLVSGSADTLMTGGASLGSFRSAVMSWQIAIVSPPASDSIRVWVTNSSNSDTFEAYYILHLPHVGMPPQGALISPRNLTWTTCNDQPIRLWFTSENGIARPSDLIFAIDGSLLHLSDPRLVWLRDTLTFYPSTPWSDGSIVSWALVSAVDAMGCSLMAPVYGEFLVDLTPPVAAGEYPIDGAILGTTAIDQVWVMLFDNVRDVDPASIRFECNGVPYTISSPALSYARDTLRFNLATAGITIEDGDTLCFTIARAADLMPDYCEPNVMAPFNWCFSVNIVDLWLPDTNLCPPGDTFKIPVYCENLSGFRISSLDIRIRYFSEIMTPIGLETAGTVCAPWMLSMATTANTVRITGSGSALTGGGVLFYIKFVVPRTGAEGAYTSLSFVHATFNHGALTTKTVDGFATVCFTNHIWTNDLVVYENAQNRKVITFGATPGGTAGYNPGLDVISVPPPASRVDGYFHIADPAYPHITQLQRDIRGITPIPIVWRGSIIASGSSIAVRWNPSAFPPGEITMTYVDGGVTYVVNMKNIDHISLSGSIDFTIVYDQPYLGRAQMTVCSGWNMVSFPFVPNEGVTIMNAIPTAITPGYWFDPALRTYVICIYPQTGKAYWVFCTAPDTFDVAGMLVGTINQNLYPGWNMVGMPWEPSGSIPLGAMTVTPSVLVPGNIFGYNCMSGEYSLPTAFSVGKGYWMLASANGHILIEGDTSAPKTIPMPEPDWVFAMTLGGKPFAIGLDDRAEIRIDGFDRAIPPYNPDGGELFGAKVGDIFLSREIKPGPRAEFELFAMGKTLLWDKSAIPAGVRMVLENDGISLSMSEFDYAVLGECAKIIVDRQLPETPVLYSAIPNPFNPITEIRFALPARAEIDLSVFDVLGRKISTISNGAFEGGTHSVVWNGTDSRGNDAPSGIYFYRLSIAQTGFYATKSMVLLR